MTKVEHLDQQQPGLLRRAISPRSLSDRRTHERPEASRLDCMAHEPQVMIIKRGKASADLATRRST
jgi:hypothetical protein